MIIYIDLTKTETLYSENFALKANDVLYIEPMRNVRLRSSNAQIYISAIPATALIANIVFGILNSNLNLQNPNELAEENEKIDLKNVVNRLLIFWKANNIIDYRLPR